MRFGNFATKLSKMQIPGFSTVMLDATCYMLTANKTQHVTTVLHLEVHTNAAHNSSKRNLNQRR